MLWISWIVCAVLLATLFSVVKTLDRLVYSVQLIDARLDLLSTSIAELASAHAGATHAHLDEARPGRLGGHAKFVEQ